MAGKPGLEKYLLSSPLEKKVATPLKSPECRKLCDSSRRNGAHGFGPGHCGAVLTDRELREERLGGQAKMSS